MTDTTHLWPSSSAQLITHWCDIAGKVMRANGLDAVDYPLARPFLLGIRGVKPYAAESHALTDTPPYDDTFVLFVRDGLLPPHVFVGSTHAIQKTSSAATDENHDGKGDVGTVDPGRFVARLDSSGKYPVFILENPDGSKVFKGRRDLDHDGIPETPVNDLTSLLIHYGYDAPPDSPHKSSIGCTIASPQYVDDMAHAAKGCGAMDYVIVTADELISMLDPPVEPFPLPNS